MYFLVVLEYDEFSPPIHPILSWQVELSLKLRVFSPFFARLCTESVIVAGDVNFTQVSDFGRRS